MLQLWIRHGSTELESGRVCGQIDPAPLLLPEECRHLQALINQVFKAGLHDVAVYSSPLRRALELAGHLGFSQVNRDDRLKELSFGRWEGLRWDDVPRKELDIWAEDFLYRRPPGGESLYDLQLRLQSFLDETPDRPVIVFTHGGVIRALATLAGVSPDQAMSMSVPLASAFLRSPDGSLQCLIRNK
jgi:alpha-ribazole phosphatase